MARLDLGNMLPAQVPGIPGGSGLFSITFIIIIPLLVAYWVHRDATRRGNEYALNWAISMFLFGFLGFFPLFVGIGLWRTVREKS